MIYSLYASLHRERRHVSECVIAGGRAVQQVMPVFVFPETEATLFRISDAVRLGYVSEKSFSSSGPSRSMSWKLKWPIGWLCWRREWSVCLLRILDASIYKYDVVLCDIYIWLLLFFPPSGGPEGCGDWKVQERLKEAERWDDFQRRRKVSSWRANQTMYILYI